MLKEISRDAVADEKSSDHACKHGTHAQARAFDPLARVNGKFAFEHSQHAEIGDGAASCSHAAGHDYHRIGAGGYYRRKNEGKRAPSHDFV